MPLVSDVHGRGSVLSAGHTAGSSSNSGLAQGLREHWLAEALKHAFAVRASLGDPGDCTGGPGPACFVNQTAVLDDLLSATFAAELRYPPIPASNLPALQLASSILGGVQPSSPPAQA